MSNQNGIRSYKDTITNENFSVTSTEVIAVEWKILDFFSVLIEQDKAVYFTCITSPNISFSHSIWTINMYLCTFSKEIMLYLKLESATEDKIVNFNFNLKKSDGKMFIEHKDNSRCCVFKENYISLGRTALVTLKELQERKSDLVPSGTLTVMCYMKESQIPDGKLKTSENLSYLETLSSNLKDLFISKRKCDIIIKVKEQEFCAHRALLVARSSVFAAMFEHDTSEEKSGVVTVLDCDPDSFGAFLEFLYSGKIEDLTFRNARHLYITADKYDIQDLKSLCVNYMMDHLTEDNVCDAVSLSEQYGNASLMSAAQSYFNQNVGHIIKTIEWEKFMKMNFHLGNKLLMKMVESNVMPKEKK